MKKDIRSYYLNLASWIGISGNTILSVLKIVIGFYSHSLAVISDGIDSTTDILTFFIILFTSKIITKPADHEHPYGHFRAETIATQIVAFIIFFAGTQLFFSTLNKIINNETMTIPKVISVYIIIASIFIKLLLAIILFYLSKKSQSSMLKANGKNMLSDVLLSIGVLIGLICIYIFNLPIIDKIIALIISLWIIRTAIMIFIETNTELMEGNQKLSLYDDVFSAVNSIKGVYNPHRVRIRHLSYMYIVDMDIEVDGKLTVNEAHNKAVQVENAIKKSIKNIYDVIIHVEPIGNIEQKEKFGYNNK